MSRAASGRNGPPPWLNPERLLAAFLAFWRRHGQPLLASAPYHEIAPHLVLMAFLHRVVNGSSSPPPVGEGPGERAGILEREYAIGSEVIRA